MAEKTIAANFITTATAVNAIRDLKFEMISFLDIPSETIILHGKTFTTLIVYRILHLAIIIIRSRIESSP